MQWLKFLLIFPFALYVLLLLIWWVAQERFLFFPTRIPVDAPPYFAESHKERWFEVASTVNVHAVQFPATSLRRGAILYLHSNAGSVASWGRNAGLFIQWGYDLIHLDYRGYGKSQGRINSESQLIMVRKIV